MSESALLRDSLRGYVVLGGDDYQPGQLVLLYNELLKQRKRLGAYPNMTIIGLKKMVSDQRFARLPIDVVQKDLSYEVIATVN